MLMLFIGIGLVVGVPMLAYLLAIYILPFGIALTVARLVYATGSGVVGAGIVGVGAGTLTFIVLAFLVATLRHPVLRVLVALVFVAPAAVAGYGLIDDITRDAVPSEVWRQVYCLAGGVFTGLSALMRLGGPVGDEQVDADLPSMSASGPPPPTVYRDGRPWSCLRPPARGRSSTGRRRQ